MRGRKAKVILAVAALVASGSVLFVALRGPGAPPTFEERVRAVASTIRCPVCQNLSVAESPSRVAQEFRDRIAADLRAGMGPDQIRAEFVRSYGEWILQAPPKRGLELAVWVLPVLLFAGGLAAASVAARRWTRATGRSSPSPEPLTDRDRALLARALAEPEAER